MEKLTLPLTNDEISKLKIQETYLLTGEIYTARDAAHKLLIEAIDNNEELPIDLNNSCIYYVGPTPSNNLQPFGSAGPTSSYRMDPYVEKLLKKGLKIMIGKGTRSDYVRELCKKYNAVYLSCVGGAGAKISKSIKKAELVAYPELGPEAIYKLYIEDLFVVVSIDTNGDSFGK